MHTASALLWRSIALSLFLLGFALANVAEARESRARKPRTRLELRGVININTATEAELRLLPGVSQKSVRWLIEHRKVEPFASRDHIMWVKGIGRKTYRRLKPHLAVTGETTLERVRVPIEQTPAQPAHATDSSRVSPRAARAP